MVKITNTSDGPRGFHAALGFVSLEAGKSWSGDIDEAELESAKGTGYFKIGGASEDEDGDKPVSLSGKNKAELLAIAEAEGVEIEDGATNDDIKAAIELHREA